MLPDISHMDVICMHNDYMYDITDLAEVIICNVCVLSLDMLQNPIIVAYWLLCARNALQCYCKKKKMYDFPIYNCSDKSHAPLTVFMQQLLNVFQHEISFGQ